MTRRGERRRPPTPPRRREWCAPATSRSRSSCRRDSARRRSVSTLGRAARPCASSPTRPIRSPRQVLSGLLQKVAMTAMPDVMARAGIEQVDRWGGDLTARAEGGAPEERRPVAAADGRRSRGAGGAGGGLVNVEVRDVLGEKKKNPGVAVTAAGLGVMFLLFSAAGAGGALIEEVESGTLDRVLSTRVTMRSAPVGQAPLPCDRRRRAADGDVRLGGDLLRPRAPPPRSGLSRDGRRDRARRVRVRPRARGAFANAHAARGALQHGDPRHVGARRKHVPALPHVGRRSEGRPRHAERVGDRRLHEGVLARRAARPRCGRRFSSSPPRPRCSSHSRAGSRGAGKPSKRTRDPRLPIFGGFPVANAGKWQGTSREAAVTIAQQPREKCTGSGPASCAGPLEAAG